MNMRSDQTATAQAWDTALKRGFPAEGTLLQIRVDTQELLVVEQSALVSRYSVSTALRGIGQQIDSLQTPTGWFAVVERYGAGLPLGAEFKARVFTGTIVLETKWSQTQATDRILTRILRLSGLEPGHNQGGSVDTYARYIYIHGTAHENRIGTPASAGCVRMRNRDIAELFDHVEGKPVWCWIGDPEIDYEYE